MVVVSQEWWTLYGSSIKTYGGSSSWDLKASQSFSRSRIEEQKNEAEGHEQESDVHSASAEGRQLAWLSRRSRVEPQPGCRRSLSQLAVLGRE